MKRLLGVLMLAVLCSAPLGAQNPAALRLHSPYGNHMVFQQKMPIRVAGKTVPGSSVKVSLGGKTAEAVVEDDGEFMAELPAMDAGGPYTLKAESDYTNLEYSDIYVGELWICSGQSNMEFPVYERPGWGLPNGEQIAEEIADPMIRIINAPNALSPGVEQKDIGCEWMVSSQKTLKNFSAVGYYFGKQIRASQKTAVGLIGTNWGGTFIHPWIPQWALLEGKNEYAKQIELYRASTGASEEERAAKIAEFNAKFKAEQKAWLEAFSKADPKMYEEGKSWKEPNYDDSKWEAFPGMIADAKSGFFWVRTHFNVTKEQMSKIGLISGMLKLSLGVIDDSDETYLNGQLVGSTDDSTARCWEVNRSYLLKPGLVKEGDNVLAVRIGNYMGEAKLVSSSPAPCLTFGDSLSVPISAKWVYKWESIAPESVVQARPAAPSNPALNGQGDQTFPGTLYNAMVAPFTALNVRGVIWYQGCNDIGNPKDYVWKQKMQIESWRKAFRNPLMPFIITQLSAYEAPPWGTKLADNFRENLPPGDQKTYTELREVQANVAAHVPNTGLAVTIDVGDHSDIHPTRKAPVGYRLAREAERLAYGSRETSAGPTFDHMKIEGGTVRIYYKNVGKGLTVSNGSPDKLREFAIAGETGDFVWADAKIDGDTVVLSSEKVPNPKRVRYAWNLFPGYVNLVNKDGFPAAPFRTDTPGYLLK